MTNTWRIALVLMVTLALVSGCAKSDWVQNTLVTVDVTGTWVQDQGARLELRLEQQGSRVIGSMICSISTSLSSRPIDSTQGPIEGTVAGDIFRFKQTNGTMEGELTVAGEEMTGHVRMAPQFSCRGLTSLRRVSSTVPSQQ